MVFTRCGVLVYCTICTSTRTRMVHNIHNRCVCLNILNIKT